MCNNELYVKCVTTRNISSERDISPCWKLFIETEKRVIARMCERVHHRPRSDNFFISRTLLIAHCYVHVAVENKNNRTDKEAFSFIAT